MSINRVVISGNLTRDPETRMTQTGVHVLSFGVAVNDRRRNADGEWVDVPNYVDCVLFGDRGKALAVHLRKGLKVVVAGKLRWSQWQDQQTGQNRSRLDVVVDDIDFMARAEQPVAQPAPQPAQQLGYQQPLYQPAPQQVQQTATPTAQQQPALGIYEEEIPF